LNKIVGLKMRTVTWNGFPITKFCWWIQNPSPLWRLVICSIVYYDCCNSFFFHLSDLVLCLCNTL